MPQGCPRVLFLISNLHVAKPRGNQDVNSKTSCPLTLLAAANFQQVWSIHTGGGNVPWSCSIFIGPHLIEGAHTLAANSTLSLYPLDCLLLSQAQTNFQPRKRESSCHGRGPLTRILWNASRARICPLGSEHPNPSPEPRSGTLAHPRYIPHGRYGSTSFSKFRETKHSR